MSYIEPIQPFITSAFSSYGVNFVSRQAAVIGRVDDTVAAGAIKTTQESKESDADTGKPKSASGDVLDLSDRAKNLAAAKEKFEKAVSADAEAKKSASTEIELQSSLKSAETEGGAAVAGSLKSGESGKELTEEEKQQIAELKARDAEVRIHEGRHVAVGGPYVTGGPSYTYQTGPDGKKYAVGGEVGIDVSPVKDDPEATIQKMQTVAAAALAPAEPSGQDYKIAAAARQAEAQARAELNSQKQNEAAQATESEDESQTGMLAAKDGDESDKSDKPALTSHYAKSYSAGSISKMISGQTSGSNFSAFV
ncbi:MAG: hypothetical protein FWE67_11720 [Planctomycetaceae bacterium]|nr:hypothetical protein [Planctomycetaceae bacterium]